MLDLVENGVYPICFDRTHNNCLYGDNIDKMLYADGIIECFLIGNPRQMDIQQ